MNTPRNSAGFEVRVSRPQRHQAEWLGFTLDELIRPDDPVRNVWAYVQSMDLSPFYADIKAVKGGQGRDAVDPAILIALWIFATLEGIGSGRRLARLCERDVAYMWICGGVGVNRELLNDFRTGYADALDELFTETIAILLRNDLVSIKRVSQDGMRVRASAGKGSFKKKESLEELLKVAREQVKQTRADIDDHAAQSKQEAARVRAAKEREARLAKAVEEHKKLAEQRERRKKGDGETTRCSFTDPDARNMKMADGGFRPALNLQAATTNDKKIIVAVDVVKDGTDSGQMEPMIAQIIERTGEQPEEYLVDGGFNSRDDTTNVERKSIKVYAPVRSARKDGTDPHERKIADTDEVFAWRQRMKTDEAKEIYKERGETAEFPNACMRNHGLHQFPVRTLKKAKTIGLWHALVHNIQMIITHGWLPVFTEATEST